MLSYIFCYIVVLQKVNMTSQMILNKVKVKTDTFSIWYLPVIE